MTTKVSYYSDSADQHDGEDIRLDFLAPQPEVPTPVIKVAGGLILKRTLPRLVPFLGAGLLAYDLYTMWKETSRPPPNDYWRRVCGSGGSFLLASAGTCGQLVYVSPANQAALPFPTSNTNIHGYTSAPGELPPNPPNLPYRKRSQYQRIGPNPSPELAPGWTGFAPDPWAPFPEVQPYTPGQPTRPRPWSPPAYWPDDPAFPDPDQEPGPAPGTSPATRPGRTVVPGPFVAPQVPPLVEIEFDPSIRPGRPGPVEGPDSKPDAGATPAPGPGEGVGTGSSPGIPPGSPATGPVAPRPPVYGGEVPLPSRPPKGTKEKKFRGTWNAIQVLQVLSEAAELVDCLYQAMPSVLAKSQAREKYGQAMGEFWTSYRDARRAGQLETAAARARFLNGKPRWNPNWADPVGKPGRYERHVSAQYSPEGAHEKLPYIYDHFDEITAGTMLDAVTCGLYNQYVEDKVLGKYYKARSNLRPKRARL